MHSTNYVNTLILPSEDGPEGPARHPARAGTVAARQHARLSAAPYGLTSDELIAGVEAERKGRGDVAAFAAEYFSVGRACLRASPLVKTHGWALHHDHEGKVALIDPHSAEFERLMADESLRKLRGMRSRRAR